jgi:hypothetical protein
MSHDFKASQAAWHFSAVEFSVLTVGSQPPPGMLWPPKLVLFITRDTFDDTKFASNAAKSASLSDLFISSEFKILCRGDANSWEALLCPPMRLEAPERPAAGAAPSRWLLRRRGYIFDLPRPLLFEQALVEVPCPIALHERRAFLHCCGIWFKGRQGFG